MGKVEFEIFGYHVDHHVDGKYIGSVRIDSPDRDVIGYNGKKLHIAGTDIIFKNKKIKKGSNYYTFLYPLCGKSNIAI